MFLRAFETEPAWWSFGFDPVRQSAFYRRVSGSEDAKIAMRFWRDMGLTPMQTKKPMTETALVASFAANGWGVMGRHLEGER